jgi:hypothetical protein
LGFLGLGLVGLGLVGGAAPRHLRAAGEENFPPLGPLVAVRWPQAGPQPPFVMGQKERLREETTTASASALWPGAACGLAPPPPFCALATWRSAEAHGGVLMC